LDRIQTDLSVTLQISYAINRAQFRRKILSSPCDSDEPCPDQRLPQFKYNTLLFLPYTVIMTNKEEHLITVYADQTFHGNMTRQEIPACQCGMIYYETF
jgi:hypothetical protein